MGKLFPYEVIFISNPTIKTEKNNLLSTRSYMLDMLIVLIPPSIMAWYYYGGRPLRTILLSVLTAVICEQAGCFVMKRKSTLGDLSAIFTGAVIALLLPASIPFWVAIVGSAFAIIVARLPFGSYERVPFVPAAAGIAFLCVCWPDLVFTYPAINLNAQTFVTGSPNFVTGESLTSMLKMSNSMGVNILGYFDVLTGNVSGPVGATCTVIMFGTAVYLLIRRTSMWVSSAGFVAVCSFAAVFFPRVLTGRKASLTMEIAGGMLVFAALFLLTNPSTLPKNTLGRLFYGMTGGAICMIFRYYGVYEEGACFAILLVNAISPVFDKVFKSNTEPKEFSLLNFNKKIRNISVEGGANP